MLKTTSLYDSTVCEVVLVGSVAIRECRQIRLYRLKVNGNATNKPINTPQAADIGCGCVALGKHIKGDSKTYLILLVQVVCISVVNPQ